MRFCFYNPQSVNFILGETLLSLCLRILQGHKIKISSHSNRFNYLLSYLKNKRYKTAIVIDGTASSLTASNQNKIRLFLSNRFIAFFISLIEVYLWCFLNGINPFQIPIICNVKKLKPQKDILFGFGFFTDTFLDESLAKRSIYNQFRGTKVLHATHYQGHTNAISINIQKTNTYYMAAETDLLKNPFFYKYFKYIRKIIILLPFLRKKYIKTKQFNNRKNKCFALGTLEFIDKNHDGAKDFLSFFHINTVHPGRKKIYENIKKIKTYIDSYIYLNNNKEAYKKYFQLNIVQKYNEYKMFISPEEIVGFPSINCVEGMACGCAYIGLRHPMYKNFGLLDKKNYIAYDGSLTDLIRKITYCKNHQKELKIIAENGYRHVHSKFTEKQVLSSFWSNLIKIQKEEQTTPHPQKSVPFFLKKCNKFV